MKECIIHGSVIDSWDMLYRKISTDFRFPEWFGGNLDALYDCLTELDDAQLTIYQWNALADALGEKTDTLKRVLLDAGLENPNLIVCILEDTEDEI